MTYKKTNMTCKFQQIIVKNYIKNYIKNYALYFKINNFKHKFNEVFKTTLS